MPGVSRFSFRWPARFLVAAVCGTLWCAAAADDPDDAPDEAGGRRRRPPAARETAADHAFGRIRERLARGMPGFEQKGLGVFNVGDELARRQPRGDGFLALPGGFLSWPTGYRVRTATGAMWLPVPPGAQARGRGDDRQWTNDHLRIRLLQHPARYQRLLDLGEALADEELANPELAREYEQAREEFERLERLDRFSLWWKMLESGPADFSDSLPFGRRVAALYLTYRKSRWPQAVTPYRGAHARAFVAAPRENTRVDADGREERQWIAEAWVAPAEGDPLVHLVYVERDRPDRELTLDFVLRHLSGVRFENQAAASAPAVPGPLAADRP